MGDSQNIIKRFSYMKLSEEIRKEIWHMASDPESVCYIEKHDGEGYKVEEIDGDYCHLCATQKAKELDKEDSGKYYHQVYEETSPEDDCFRNCEECGCLLNAALIVSRWNEDDFNHIVDDLKRAKTFNDIKGDLAWKIDQVLDSEDEACELFPKQMQYIGRRLANLYKKKED